MNVNDMKQKLKDKYDLSFDDVELDDLKEISKINFSKNK